MKTTMTDWGKCVVLAEKTNENGEWRLLETESSKTILLENKDRRPRNGIGGFYTLTEQTWSKEEALADFSK